MRNSEYIVYFKESKPMKKKCIGIVAICTLVCLVCSLFCACGTPKEPLVLKESDTFIVIKADESVGANDTLMDYMSKLKANGALQFEINGGMITSVNGIANAPDWSSCWMLYTSDTANANDAWGKIKYEDTEYGSATLGAEKLVVKAGAIYIWVYQSF